MITVNSNIVMKNLQSFCSPYDRLDMEAVGKFLEMLERYPSLEDVKISVTLRHPALNIPYLQADMPAVRDVTHNMLWVVSNRPDAVAALSVKNGSNGKTGQTSLYEITEGDFTIRANRNLAIKGVVENTPGADGWGTIRRVRSGIPFHTDWCLTNKRISRGAEVSFLPVIIRTEGIQARCVELI